MIDSSEVFFSPLVKIGRMYVEEAAHETGSLCGIREASEAITRFICGRCPYSEAARMCQTHVNTTEPAEKIQTILSIASGEAAESPPIPRKISKRCRLWNHEDDVRLLAGLRRFGIGDWKRIAEFVGNDKTSSQCSQRWSRALNPSLSKEQWTEEQDRELCEYVAEYGEHSWACVTKLIGCRSDVQCRYRFEQLKKTKKGQPVLRLIEDPVELLIEEFIPPLLNRESEGMKGMK
jgi:hypothetical protein